VGNFLQSVSKRWLPFSLRTLWRHLMTDVWTTQDMSMPDRVLATVTDEDILSVLRQLCDQVEATGQSVMVPETLGNRASQLIRRVMKQLPNASVRIMLDPKHSVLAADICRI
jgi:hypothetical protein